tara:strand:- start:204575 stop:205048 length:474 start_codon:yes stop_codon:yes gene_type:complete
MSKENTMLNNFADLLKANATVTESDNEISITFNKEKVEAGLEGIEGAATITEVKKVQETTGNLAAAMGRVGHELSFETVKSNDKIETVTTSHKLGGDTIKTRTKRQMKATNLSTGEPIDVYGSTSISVSTSVSGKRQPCKDVTEKIKAAYVSAFSDK